MSTLDRIRGHWKKSGHRGVTLIGDIGPQKTIYSQTSITNTSSDFTGDYRSIDAWMMQDGQTARARSRQLERGNPWAQSFKLSLLNNVLGHRGFKFKSNVINSEAFGDEPRFEGVEDKKANIAIQTSRKRFEMKGNFTTSKKLTGRMADRMLLQRLAFDGEVIIRRVPKFDNEFKFAWQIIDPVFLDWNLNKTLANGNIVKMGVEINPVYGYPVAYWFLTRTPNEYLYGQQAQETHKRVEASEIHHIFIQEYPNQTRGIPWIFAAMINLNNIGAYEEAALINARVGANKMGFFKKKYPDGWAGNPQANGTDGTCNTPDGKPDSGVIIENSEPGTWTELPYGVEPVDWNPKYPDAEFAAFNKAMLRGCSAAMGTSYMDLSNDLSEANFSSMRAGENAARENWMAIQTFWEEEWKQPEFAEWLTRAILSSNLKLPLAKYDKLNAPKFTGRRWPYVNPLQDRQAEQIALDNCTTSISEIIERGGGEPAEVFAQQAKDKEAMDLLGIARIHSTFQVVDVEKEQAALPAPKEPDSQT